MRWMAVFVGIAIATILYGYSDGISWAGLRLSPCYPNCFLLFLFYRSEDDGVHPPPQD
jgi:hypothetical protein